jgi:hypothetical protein
MSAPTTEIHTLYPELGKHNGSLAQALDAELLGIGSTLRATTVGPLSAHIVHARVEYSARFSQVFLAAKERLFMFDAWCRGVCLGNGSTPDLALAAQAIDTWVSGAGSIFELAERFRGTVAANAEAAAFERGTEVEARWHKYLTEDLEPLLVAAASQRPTLRQLFPFFSLYSLCFSRCSGYPYTRDLPSIRQTSGGAYLVKHPVHGESEPLELEQALDRLLTQVPANCGPAVAGTADDYTCAAPEGEPGSTA